MTKTSEKVHDRAHHNTTSLNRIRRIKGQLESLEQMIAEDGGSCEDRVLRARTIEKGITSLINHLVICYLDNTAHAQMQDTPDDVVDELKRIIGLMNK